MHAYHHLFHRRLFDLPSSLFVSGNDLCIKLRGDDRIACYCSNPSTNPYAQKCPHCGNPVLVIENALCLMAPLKEIEKNHFFQTLYFFCFDSLQKKHDLILQRVAIIDFNANSNQIIHKEFNALCEIESFHINLLHVPFYGQSNTLRSLRKGLMPLDCYDFEQNWKFDRSSSQKKKLRDFPLHVQQSIEFILLTHHERFCPIFSTTTSIFMTYYAYHFQRKHHYLKDLSIPLIHSTNSDFYAVFDCHTSLNTLVEEGIFQHKASKAIKRWFFKMLNQKDVFILDALLVLVQLFNNKDYLLHALCVVYQSNEFQRKIILGDSLLAYLREQKGEKWLIKHIFNEDFYSCSFEDLAINFDYIKDDLTGFVLPKIENMDDLTDVIMLYLEMREYEHSNEVFTYSAFTKSFEGRTGDFSFRLPKSPYELSTWAQEHRNCLTHYQTQIKEGSCIVLGVFSQNSHRYTLALDGTGQLLEAKAKYNRPIPKYAWVVLQNYINLRAHSYRVQ